MYPPVKSKNRLRKIQYFPGKHREQYRELKNTKYGDWRCYGAHYPLFFLNITKNNYSEWFYIYFSLLCYDPEKRLTSSQALNHPWFRESPIPTVNTFFSLNYQINTCTDIWEERSFLANTRVRINLQIL